MKQRFLILAAFVTLLSVCAFAQDKPKPDGKSKVLVFPPGAKTPETGAKPPVAPPLRSAVAPGAQDAASPADIAGQFFGSLREGEIDRAYATLTKGSKVAERPEELRVLKQKTKEAIEVFGVIAGYELVDNKTVGTRLMRSTYVSLGKEFPLRWRFYFYKADNVWRLVDLRVDDKLTGVFDEPEEPKPAEPKL